MLPMGGVFFCANTNTKHYQYNPVRRNLPSAGADLARGCKCAAGEHFVCETVGMRADRLVATLLLMQARGRVTAAELAAELEISVATARRDLEALSTAGIPVYPQPGRNGGWSLLGGSRTDLSGLTSTEAQALFLLVGPAAAGSGEAKAALRDRKSTCLNSSHANISY